MALTTVEPPTLPLHLKVLIHPVEGGFFASCLETCQPASEPTLEEAVKVITELIDSQLLHLKRGFPLSSLLRPLPPKFYEIFESSRPYPYQPSLSQEVSGVIGSIEYRISDEVLTNEAHRRYLSE